MVTSIYAAILGIILIRLSIKTIQARRKLGVGIGDGNNLQMRRFIRAQGNFVEYAAIFLILLGHAEINGLPIWTINFLGMLFLIGRIMHAYSLLKDEEYQTASNLVSYPKWRIRGMILTFIAIGSLAITILIQMAMVFVNHFLQ